jgi:TolB protein
LYPTLGQLEAGTVVEIIGQNEEGTWWQIDYESGAGGRAWVSAEYVQTSDEVEFEVLEAPPVPATAVPAFAGKIVFQEVSGGRIFVINANGTGLRQLTEGLDPALSPDGIKVAFTRWTAPAGIYLINVDGTEERLLTEVQQSKSPEWSLDGTKIAFTHRSGGGFDFYWDSEKEIVIKTEDPHWVIGVADVATGEFADVHSETHSFSPSWSNDGWWLVYDGVKGLMLTDATADSMRWRQVSYRVRDMSPDWSPAPGSDAWGAPIAFMVFHNDHYEIHTILPSGQGQTRLTASPMFEAAQNSVAPEWSPDGRWIGFLTDRRGMWEVWVMRADGSQQQPLFRPGVLEGIEFRYEAQSEQVLDWGP